MPFEKGNKLGVSGRPVGIRNQRSARFAELIELHGFNAAEEFVWIYSEAKERYQAQRNPHFLSLALDAASEITNYCYPKLKSIEQTKESPLKDMTAEQKLEAMRNAVQALEMEVKLASGSK